MLKTKADYKRAFAIVTELLNEWDPYSLIASGAPPDEFDAEAGAIVRRLSEIGSPQDASRIISEVFSHWMSADDFPIVSCIDVGQDLYIALRKEEWVP